MTTATPTPYGRVGGQPIPRNTEGVSDAGSGWVVMDFLEP
jgi:hypothetical protein